MLGGLPGELLGRLLCSFRCWSLGEVGGELVPGELFGRLLCCPFVELSRRSFCPLKGVPGLPDCWDEPGERLSFCCLLALGEF